MQKEVLQAYGNMDLQEGKKKTLEFFLIFSWQNDEQKIVKMCKSLKLYEFQYPSLKEGIIMLWGIYVNTLWEKVIIKNICCAYKHV